jgi:hypothetical protein
VLRHGRLWRARRLDGQRRGTGGEQLGRVLRLGGGGGRHEHFEHQLGLDLEHVDLGQHHLDLEQQHLDLEHRRGVGRLR